MSERLDDFIGRHRLLIEAALSDYLPLSAQPHARRLNEALRYAIFPGGKRWRPILTLLGSEVVGASPVDVMPIACAMEFLHTSSIIIDDLPAMDDADLRRGRESVHVIYGESIALLAALALLNESYKLLVRGARENGSCGAGAGLIEEATRWIGSNGMIGGQAVDLALQGAGQWADALGSRNLKTTALMRLTLMSGAVASGADEERARVLADFGETLGTAYQICDDLLDELGASHELGKPAKQDSRHSRTTFVVELGIEGAHGLASSLIADGKRSLRERFGDRPATEMLSEAAELIVQEAGRLTMAEAS